MRVVVALALACVLAACGSPSGDPGAATSAPPSTAPTTATTTPSARPTPSTPSTPAKPARPRERRIDGIDVSHHQGAIDWTAVAGDGVRFAYLKATEGSTFTDPRFAENWRAATEAGLRVGAYHYFTLCADPAPQAEHYAATVEAAGPARRALPPVVDLELIGNCDPPPDRADLRADVEAFVADVEQRTGRRVVVYTHPDFDARYGDALGLDRRRWVRRKGDVPPPGAWWIWQRSDSGSVAGIAGPVDLDVMRVRR